MRTATIAATCVYLCFAPAHAADAQVPKPYVVAPECTDPQRESAIAVLQPAEPVIACYFLQKWSYKGVAIAVEPTEFVGRDFSSQEFRAVRRVVIRDQSVRLRAERDLREAMPGEPPPHAGTPLSLFVTKRTPLGVFLDEPSHIGYADLVPVAPYNDQKVPQQQFPVIQLETLVLVKGKVIKLIQLSPISGPSTIGEGFRMADDWARRLNGGERLAIED